MIMPNIGDDTRYIEFNIWYQMDWKCACDMDGIGWVVTLAAKVYLASTLCKHNPNNSKMSLHYLIDALNNPQKGITMPILRIKKLKLREVK